MNNRNKREQKWKHIFDNSATTRCFEEVKDIVVKTMMEDFGNPSAMHQKGVDAEGYVKESARTLAQILKVTEKEILFTSGGTESNNLALIGGALANKRSGNHIITTAVEHAAVSQPVAFLQEQGFEVTILPVDGHGVVKLDALEKALRPDTILVSTMMVNNETGAVMPVEKIGAMIQEKCPKALYHVDAIQAFGKYRIYPKKWNIHLLSVSSHKIHGTKRSWIPVHQQQGKSTASHSRRRPAERHAFRNRQRTGNRRTWRCGKDDVPEL